MRPGLWIIGFLFLFILLPLNAGIIPTVFEADVIGPTISIQVPGYVYFGNISKGQEIRTADKLRVNNTGNVPIIVIPQLDNSSEDLFNNLYFSLLAGGPFKKIESFSFNISAPASQGAVTYEEFYAKLDLKNYSGTLPAGVVRRRADVIFMAVAQ